MKRHYRYLFVVAVLIALPWLYGGCVLVFSSGDHSDKDKDEDDLKQVLAAGPATVNAANAVAFAAGAVAGGPAPQSLSGFSGGTTPDPGVENAFRSMRLPAVLAAALGRIGPDPAAISFSLSDVIEEDGSASGPCGGRFGYSLEFDRGSENFGGRLDFADYCIDGITVSSTCGVEGIFNGSSGEIVSARLTFEHLGIDGLDCKGVVEVDIFDGIVEAYLEIDTSGSASAEGVALSGYFVDIVPHPGYDEVWISGSYGHPELGTVELETTRPFIVHSEDRWPSSGVAVVTGESATAAALTAVDFTRFRVTVDEGGADRLSRYLGMHAWE
jgi:hypothetical protein